MIPLSLEVSKTWLGKADMINFHLEWDMTFRNPFCAAFLWLSVVKAWFQGELRSCTFSEGDAS